MMDIRPIAHVIGALIAFIGFSMLIPAAVELYLGMPSWDVFARSSLITVLIGMGMSLATANSETDRLSIQQLFLLATTVWWILPIFAALPFIIGATDASVTDAFFEAMSGMTTTGSTVFSNLSELPHGILIWRSMLQWFGGIGIIVVAMVFLPELRVGGMQVFRSESFETDGKVLPRATQIALRIFVIYLGLTLICYTAYLMVGMSIFDAFNHAMTTLSTGGFSTSDASFGAFQGRAEYVAVMFMILASLPFVRYVQLLAGSWKPLWRDSQIHAYLAVILIVVLALTLYLILTQSYYAELGFRQSLFNVVSIISGTGYASVDYQIWGGFAVVMIFFVGLIGGCAGSTSCSIKIFRYQLLVASMGAQIRKIRSPHGIFVPKYQGQSVGEDVLSSVMAFFTLFLITLGVIAILLNISGLDMVTSISGAATAIGNIGPGFGDIIGPAGNFGPLNDFAKWVLICAMFIGRLEVMAVFALFTIRFWRG